MAPPTSGLRLKQEIQKSFKLHGYQLRLDGCKYLEDLLSELGDPQECRQWIDKILEVLQRKELDSAILTKSVLEKAVQVSSFDLFGLILGFKPKFLSRAFPVFASSLMRHGVAWSLSLVHDYGTRWRYLSHFLYFEN